MALTDDLVSHWKLDEASGNALDAHGTNELTDTNTVGTAAGKINNGRDFERGTKEQFTIASNADLVTGDIDFTYAAWIKPESANECAILGKWADSGNQRGHIMYMTEGGVLQFAISADGTSAAIVNVSSGVTASAGSWYFIVIWHDAANNTLNIQVNNAAPVSSAHSGGVFASTAGFEVGAYNNNTNHTFDGVIDEVSFWKRVLTSDERTELYNGGDGLDYDDWDAAGETVTPDPVSATWSTVTPSRSLSLAAGVASASWSVVAPSVSLSLAASPASATWSTVAPAIGGALTEEPDPVVTTWSVVAPSLSLSRSVSPATATWAIPAPSLAIVSPRLTQAIPALQWSVPSPAKSLSLAPQPIGATWALATPGMAMARSVSPALATWATSAPTVGGAPINACVLAVDVFTPGMVRGDVFTAGTKKGQVCE